MHEPSELTIASWNMLVLNKKLDDAFEFIRRLDLDILCLQEVPEPFVERLRSLPYRIAISHDSVWVADGHNPDEKQRGDFLVLLSKYPIQNIRTYSLPRFAQNWRVIAVRMLMRLIHPTRVGEVYDREFLSADVQIGNKTIRVFCVHFPNIKPSVRRAEFTIVAAHIDPSMPTVICGDFNILDHWTMKPLNWLQGGRFREMFPWYDERKYIGKQMDAADFQNPLAGMITMQLARGQLDHILVPKDATILERNVLKETHGSDHNPVSVKLRL